MATASKIGSDRPVTTAIILAAGGDDESRELLHAELSDSTVAALAVQNLRQVLPAERIIVVVAPSLAPGTFNHMRQAAGVKHDTSLEFRGKTPSSR